MASTRAATSKRDPQLGLDNILGPSADLRRRIERLAAELLENAGEHGVGFDEVRHAAEQRGLLTGFEEDRYLAFGSSSMKRAGGIVVRWRKSRHARRAGARVAVYVHKKFNPVPAE